MTDNEERKPRTVVSDLHPTGAEDPSLMAMMHAPETSAAGTHDVPAYANAAGGPGPVSTEGTAAADARGTVVMDVPPVPQVPVLAVDPVVPVPVPGPVPAPETSAPVDTTGGPAGRPAPRTVTGTAHEAEAPADAAAVPPSGKHLGKRKPGDVEGLLEPGVSVGSDGTIRIRGVRPASAFFYSLFMGIAYGVVAFAVMALVVAAMDRTGLITAINSLLGEAMQLSTGKLYMLSGLFSAVLTVAFILMGFLRFLMFNVSTMVLGAFKVDVAKDGAR